MQKLYEKQEVLFAVLWIAAYCTVIAPIKQRFGFGSVWMLLALLAFAGSITAFVKASHAEEKYGLAGWPRDTKRFLYFLPMWILATGNLWGGFVPSFIEGDQILIIRIDPAAAQSGLRILAAAVCAFAAGLLTGKRR